MNWVDLTRMIGHQDSSLSNGRRETYFITKWKSCLPGQGHFVHVSIAKTPVRIILWCPSIEVAIKACFLIQSLEQEGGYQKCCISLCRVSSQRAHDAIITSLWRQNYVATSFWCHNDVIIASWVRWVVNLAGLNIDLGSCNCRELWLSCNASWADVIGGNSHRLPSLPTVPRTSKIFVVLSYDELHIRH